MLNLVFILISNEFSKMEYIKKMIQSNFNDYREKGVKKNQPQMEYKKKIICSDFKAYREKGVKNNQP